MVKRIFADRAADPPAGRGKIATADDDGGRRGWEPAATMHRKLLATALIACGLPLAAAGTAAADSIVFIQDQNLWVAEPDGTGARAITADGAQSPYWSPSQSDGGTIAVAHRERVELWNRDGTKLAELDPPALTDSVSHPVDGAVADVAISPDGQTIAFAYAKYSCPVAADCTGRSTLGYMPTSGTKPAGEYGGGTGIGEPSWVTSSRTLAFGGYNHQVNTHDLGPGTTDVHWFDDWQISGQENATDLGDGELNAQGTKLVAVRGYGDGTHIVWYATNGAPPAHPTSVCNTGKLAGLHGPTFAPDGDRMAWGEPDGVWTIASTTTEEARCADVQPKLTLPGGSEPDWGPADPGAPKPPVVPPVKGDDPAKPPVTQEPAVQELVTVDLPKKARLKGFTATVSTYAAGTLTATVKRGAKVILKGSATAKAAGDTRLKLRPTKAGRKLRKATRAKLTVVFTAPGKQPQPVVETVRLAR